MRKPLFQQLRFPISLLVLFWALAVILSLVLHNSFYLFNFGYIGSALGIGLGVYALLPRKQKLWGRRLAQFLIGLYMLVFLGLMERENMQIEGFFFYLLSGVFAGSVIHYLVAKVIGPVIFGRGWCGWACWTAMVLDLLPYQRSRHVGLERKYGFVRLIHLGLSLALVLILWFVFSYRPEIESIRELYWLMVGNLLYYGAGIGLAFYFKDNRAFCKILCPIPMVQKPAARLAMFGVKADAELCKDCGACSIACPMDVDVRAIARQGGKITSTECILCMECVAVCPHGALK